MTLRRPHTRHPAAMKHCDHGLLWRLVEGGVVDAFRNHPEYLTLAGNRSAVQSITKRVVGQLVGHAKQARVRGRFGPPGGGSGGGADESRMPAGVGLLPHTRFPRLHDLLVGGC